MTFDREVVSTVSRGRRIVVGTVCALLTLAFLAVSIHAADAATSPSFARSDYAAGLGPTFVAPSDVNGDGSIDLVVTNAEDDTVSVLAGDGTGGFSAAVSFPTSGDWPFGVAVADLSGDGIRDLAIANRTSATVTILRGDGSGGFSFLRSIAVGAGAINVDATDLNEDGKKDLVVSQIDAKFVTVLLGNGTGNFTRRDSALPATGATDAGLGDLNEDGHVDVVVGHYYSTTATVRFGDGAGNLSVGPSLAVGTNPLGVACADLNYDGHLDVCVASRNPNNVNVYVGDGTGAFSTATTYPVGSFSKAIVVSDLNLDGVVDLGVSNYNETTVSLLTGLGDGSFDPQVKKTVGTQPHGIAVADLNSDGKPDLAVPNYGSASVSVLLNTTSTSNTDTTPPVTTCSADNAWHNGPVTVTFRATDSGSGVDYTQYSTNGGSTWKTGTSLTVTGQGTHPVTYRSVDNAGNWETSKTATVKIDLTAPVTTQSGADGEWHAKSVTVTLTPSDAGGSGVDYTEYSTNGGSTWTRGTRLSVSTEGTHTISFRSIDDAGNVETTKTATVKIDLTDPVTTQSGADGAWHARPVTVTFSATDAGGSGLDYTEYSLDGGTTWRHGASLTLSEDGVYQIAYRSADIAGNVETARTATVRVDVTAPVTKQSGASADWQNQDVRVVFSAADGTSGVRATRYSTDGGATWMTGTSLVVPAPADHSNDGVHTILYRSEDNVGNLETVRTTAVKIDTIQPKTTQSGADGRWHNHDVNVSFAAVDPSSGVQSTSFSTDGGRTWQTGSLLVLVASPDHLGDGIHTILYRSVDAAGNIESARTCTVAIDTRRPTTVALSDATVRRGGTATLRFRVNDLSPCASTATVVISVRTLSGKYVKTLRLSSRRVNVNLAYSFHCNLAKRTYRFFVLAQDRAGNRNIVVGSRRLVVR